MDISTLQKFLTNTRHRTTMMQEEYTAEQNMIVNRYEYNL